MAGNTNGRGLCGLQGEKKFVCVCETHSSKVIGPNVKFVVTAPPSGQSLFIYLFLSNR